MLIRTKAQRPKMIAFSKPFRVLLWLVMITIIIVLTNGSESVKAQAHNYETLIAKAREKGSLPIIVGLRMGFVPEGQLPDPTAVKKQRDKIAALQDAIVEKLKLSDVPPISIKRYRYVPSIAMEATAGTLERLISLPEVKQIGEDVAMPPLSPM